MPRLAVATMAVPFCTLPKLNQFIRPNGLGIWTPIKLFALAMTYCYSYVRSSYSRRSTVKFNRSRASKRETISCDIVKSSH